MGYARTSTLEQVAGFEAQIEALTKAGCEKLYREQVSSVAYRPALEEALGFMRQGDVFVVTKLDRLARSVTHLWEIVSKLEQRGIGLHVLEQGMDTTTATGRFMLNMLVAVAEFERSMMLERQREGIAKAKAEGKYTGRVPTVARQADKIKAMAEQGMTKKAIAEALGASERSVYRTLRAY